MLMGSRAGYSLQSRLLVAVTVLLTLFLGLTGFVLDRAFRSSLETGVSQQLQTQLYVLLAAVDETGGEFYFSENLREPRFSQLNTGLYGFISSPGQGELLRTPSALEFSFPALAPDSNFGIDLNRGETRVSRYAASSDSEFFIINYAVTWENRPQAIVFSVLESTDNYLNEVSAFRGSLFSWLGGLAVLLLVLQLLLLRWGLSPLRRLARDLKQIETGLAESLGTDYPAELSAVTQNLNLLIQTERKQQTRYRTTLADLAHSLKTPLAVIQGEMLASMDQSLSATAREDHLSLVQEQLDRMNQIISYQLQRAVRSGNVGTLASQVNIAQAAQKICRALEKVYAGKSVSIEQHIDPRLNFLGDERDLMELLGNVLDNACKYGYGRVRIFSVLPATSPPRVELVVEDNGPGIADNDSERILQRGVRLDTLAQGQGIGLAVVVDIVQSYGGKISVRRSESGGAAIVLLLANIRVLD
ncbi:MAG: ATP-binding protein [Pseudohongiella sp.]|nr:ATP-binding protein [Pseudohongiella sp.]MDP2128388.1 ATP-binding protein [Pseudohongiella sp.]